VATAQWVQQKSLLVPKEHTTTSLVLRQQKTANCATLATTVLGVAIRFLLDLVTRVTTALLEARLQLRIQFQADIILEKGQQLQFLVLLAHTNQIVGSRAACHAQWQSTAT